MSTEENNTEGEEGKIYFYKNGKRQLSAYGFFKEIGWLSKLEEAGHKVNPTHSFLELKTYRQKEYEKSKTSFLEERRIDRVETSEKDLLGQYYAWLKGELTVIEKWLPTDPSKERCNLSTSGQIEVAKYKYYVQSEMKRVQDQINPPVSKSESPLDNFNSFKWEIENFLDNVKLYLNDDVKLRNYCAEVNEGLVDLTHRAQLELEKLLFTNNNGADRLIKSIKNFIAITKAEDAKTIKMFGVVNAKRFLKVRGYYVVMNSFFTFCKFAESINISESVEVINQTESESRGNSPTSLQEIFLRDDWKKYIEVLTVCDPCLLDTKWNYIGKPKGHKGLLCSWIKHLQTKSIIRRELNRQQLARILNASFPSFELGADGKTFDNYATDFDDFRNQLENLLNK